MTPPAMITATGLARTFTTRHGVVEAVRGVDLRVDEREIVGFLGPNGAGKTTTLRMLATLIAPTAGEATVAGCDLRRDPVGVRRNIGYVAQVGSTLPEARAGEEVVDHARLYGVDKATAVARSSDLFAALDLEGMWKRPCKSLSGGQRRRLDIAMGLIHQPRLIFLDEPTTGLDPQARANLWEHIRRLRADGATVFLTTHYLDEADALCDRILVIDHGQIVAEGSPDELKARVSGDAVRLVAASEADVSRLLEIVAQLPDAPKADAAGAAVSFRVQRGGSLLPSLMRAIDQAGVEVETVEVHRPTLDDVFLTMTGRSLRDEPEHEAGAEPETNEAADPAHDLTSTKG